MITPAAEILRAVNPLEVFAEEYNRLAAKGLLQKQIARRLRLSPDALRHRLRKAKTAALIEPPAPRPESVVAPKPAAPCGTHAAYARHQRNGETVDEACAQARRDYLKAWSARPSSTPRERPACGTNAGFARHQRYGEQPDFACAEAHRRHVREWRARRLMAAAA